ncbi:MAG: hypothetical protein JWQ30_780 [Sediminibacterium sp.]|nr:hypothetical protein [Sediminibacterium sp.]
MKKLVSCLLGLTLFCVASMGQEKRPPEKELKAQVNHVKSSGNDLLHLRFKKAHEKHVAEANRRNKGIVKDINGEGKPLPKPATPKLPAPKKPPLR